MPRSTFIRIEDYKEVRQDLREFMKYTKVCKTRPEYYARLRFIKSLKLEVDAFLKAHGMLRRYGRYNKG